MGTAAPKMVYTFLEPTCRERCDLAEGIGGGSSDHVAVACPAEAAHGVLSASQFAHGPASGLTDDQYEVLTQARKKAKKVLVFRTDIPWNWWQTTLWSPNRPSVCGTEMEECSWLNGEPTCKTSRAPERMIR